MAIMERFAVHSDPRQDLIDAFSIFDMYVLWCVVQACLLPSDGTGMIDASEFRSVMGNLGERLDATESKLAPHVPVHIRTHTHTHAHT